MKKTVIFLTLAALMTTVMAQSTITSPSDIFSMGHKWSKIAGYSYQPGYPYGFSLFGGSFLSVGFAEKGTQYTISTEEYREPTWSIRCGWIGHTFGPSFGWKAVTFRPMLVMGMDMAKAYTQSDSKNKVYFTMAPTLVVNVYMVHFSVGYEMVPAFSQLNGLNFGAGFSIPVTEAEKGKAVAK